jgi:hypothetical protein
MTTVVHLLDRPRAFAEARRVLAPRGRLVIGTIDPAGAERFWLASLFPSYAAIDRRRFPSPATLISELRAAAFSEVSAHARPAIVRYPRERALEKLRGRFASSMALMDEHEIAAGIRRAERELPEVVETEVARLFVVASA